ncbi:uncharacterized histidine-rich protein DDB_G0274557-like [Macrobrachium nipponense]|uniref:uncharacterized histidine-rich protein DDB_G0274557-like n=1 Tax=Macrobrachium nipponense TaxID=159736 RepID=UPI0030C88120
MSHHSDHSILHHPHHSSSHHSDNSNSHQSYHRSSHHRNCSSFHHTDHSGSSHHLHHRSTHHPDRSSSNHPDHRSSHHLHHSSSHHQKLSITHTTIHENLVAAEKNCELILGLKGKFNFNCREAGFLPGWGIGPREDQSQKAEGSQGVPGKPSLKGSFDRGRTTSEAASLGGRQVSCQVGEAALGRT